MIAPHHPEPRSFLLDVEPWSQICNPAHGQGAWRLLLSPKLTSQTRAGSTHLIWTCRSDVRLSIAMVNMH